MRKLLREFKRQLGWAIALGLVPACGTGCYASGGYSYGYRSGYYVAPAPPVYYEPGPYYRPARADCAFVDMCPNGARRCCFTAEGYPTRVIP
jgi:hypothetical protein